MENSPSSTFDHSPAESFLSAPGDTYPSLFAATTPSVDSSTMNPMDMMTPQSTDDDKSQLRLSPVPEGSDEENKDSDSPRKSGKKRKSWGQVLPEPKTNLPPRKRAKTDDEKEQRRVERVLRNRRAAQSSRERKRVEVEALEKRNEELEEQLQHARNTNIMLAEELHRVRGSSGDVTSSTSPLVPLGNNPVTLSQELFRSQATDSETAKAFLSNLFTPTVNPASLSPELAPVPDSTEALTEETTGNSGTVVRPAVSNVGGAALVAPSLPGFSFSDDGLGPTVSGNGVFSIGHFLGLPEAADVDRALLEGGLLDSPLSTDAGDDHLPGNNADFELFNIDDFFNDAATHLNSDTMAESSNTAAQVDLDAMVHDPENLITS